MRIPLRRTIRTLAVPALLLVAAQAWALPDRAHKLASQAASQVAETCPENLAPEDCHRDHPTGCTTSTNPRYDAYLNFLKNQQPSSDLTPVALLSFDDLVSLEDKIPPDLNTRNHAANADALANLGEGNIYSVVGYLYFIEDTAGSSKHQGETCNCKLTEDATFDFHLGIGFDPKIAKRVRQHSLKHDPLHPGALEHDSIVAEMTPHTRNAKWTVARVQANAGKAVKVVGQLIIDNAHLSPTQDCAFAEDPDPKCWRGSAWEIHPITQFLVCKAGSTCTSASPDSAWVRLESIQ